MAVEGADGEALHQKADDEYDAGNRHQGQPEVARHPGDGEAYVGAQHQDGAVGEVHHPHHAKDEGQP